MTRVRFVKVKSYQLTRLWCKKKCCIWPIWLRL